MKIRLDLAGELDDALDDADTAAYDVADGATVSDLLAALPFGSRVALTAVNGDMVPPADRHRHRLAEGDEVMMLPAVKGG